jgi:hypothetical protein
VCVSDDGRIDLVLVDSSRLGDDRYTYRPNTPDAPHEQLGPLPTRYLLGLQAVPHRCGRPTKTGRPCRITVTHPGEPCGRHRDREMTR